MLLHTKNNDKSHNKYTDEVKAKAHHKSFVTDLSNILGFSLVITTSEVSSNKREQNKGFSKRIFNYF